MKKYISMILIILIMMIELLPVSSIFAMSIPAEVLQAVRQEAPNRPPEKNPDDDTGNLDGSQDDKTEDGEEEEKVEVDYKYQKSYEYIEGNVFEDLGNTYTGEQKDAETATINVKDILVALCDENGKIKETTRTDESGNWNFGSTENPLSEGTYSIQYFFGSLYNDNQNGIDIDLDDANTVKNVLKYNGLDYNVSYLTKGGEYSDVTIIDTYTHQTYTKEEWEIKHSGNTATQVVIALDCSATMRNDYIKMGNGEKTKLEIAVDSTKKLINKLLEGTNNIYISLIFFCGENYRAVDKKQDEAELTKALDDIRTNDYCIAYTDVYSALTKAEDTFVEGVDNRYIVLVSDGSPSKAGEEMPTWDELDSAMAGNEAPLANKLENIAETTRNEVKNILNNNINFTSLFTLPNETAEDQETIDWVRYIFGDFETINGNNDFNIIEDGNDLEYTIVKKIKEQIEKDAETHRKEETKYTIAKGYEDDERFQEIIDNFQEYNYKNSSLFDLIENYNPATDKEDAKKLSGYIYGHAYGGNGYKIEKYSDTDPDYNYTEIEYTDENGEKHTVKVDENTTEYTDENGVQVKIDKKIIHEVKHTGHSEAMGLRKKPPFRLRADIEATGLEIKLQNGTQYTNKQREFKSNEVLVETMDEKLSYGSEVIVTYTGQVKNGSSIITPVSAMQLICYVPQWVTMKKVDGQGYILQEVSAEMLKGLHEDGYISDELYNNVNNKKRAYILIFDSNEQNYTYSGFEQTSNACEFKIQCSARIKTLDDIADVTCICEMLSYSNLAYMRNTKVQNNQLITIHPGNGNAEEVDYAETKPLGIMPPTGLTKAMIMKDRIIKTTLVVLTFAGVIIAIILFKITKKNKKE